MPDMPTPEEIAEKALQPESYENDGEKIKQRSAADTIALLNYARKSRISTRRAMRALGISRISTPGAGDYE